MSRALGGRGGSRAGKCTAGEIPVPGEWMENYSDKRASPRLAAKIPVVASGRDAAHKPVNEKSETLLINDAGALLALAAEFETQGRLYLTNSNTGQSCEARVAWRSSARINGRWSYGVALVDAPPHFWGTARTGD